MSEKTDKLESARDDKKYRALGTMEYVVRCYREGRSQTEINLALDQLVLASDAYDSAQEAYRESMNADIDKLLGPDRVELIRKEAGV